MTMAGSSLLLHTGHGRPRTEMLGRKERGREIDESSGEREPEPNLEIPTKALCAIALHEKQVQTLAVSAL